MPDVNVKSSLDIEWVQLQEQGTDPVAPASGLARFYAKATGFFVRNLANGAETYYATLTFRELI